MTQELFLSLSHCRVVFALNHKRFPVRQGTVLFNAPRPLVGQEHPCQEWCHGRHYAEVDMTDPYASHLVQKNINLDARIVLDVNDAEVVEMLLIGNRYADRYREFPFDERLVMLLPLLRKIQHLEYGDAHGLLEAAKAGIQANAG
jgi:hypothetical protein